MTRVLANLVVLVVCLTAASLILQDATALAEAALAQMIAALAAGGPP